MLGLTLSEVAMMLLWLAFVVGLGLAWAIGFTGPFLGLHCAGCGYDMDGLGATCPECGRRFRYASDPIRRRRPWRLLPWAVVCLVPAPVWTAGGDDIRKAWWLVTRPEWDRLAIARSGSLEVRVLRGGRPGTQADVAYEVRRNGRRATLVRGTEGSGVPAWTECQLADLATTPGLVDLTGDGVDEIVLETRTPPGDLRGIIVLDPTRGEQPIVETRLYAPILVPAKGDRPAHLIVWDTTLAHWKGSGGEVGLLPVALVWNGDRLQADPGLTARAQGLEGETIASLLSSVAARPAGSAHLPIHPQGWRTMASLVYAGRRIEAAELFARVWITPPSRGPEHPVAFARDTEWSGGGRDAFVGDFEAMLRRSPWWSDLFEP